MLKFDYAGHPEGYSLGQRRPPYLYWVRFWPWPCVRLGGAGKKAWKFGFSWDAIRWEPVSPGNFTIRVVHAERFFSVGPFRFRFSTFDYKNEEAV